MDFSRKDVINVTYWWSWHHVSLPLSSVRQSHDPAAPACHLSKQWAHFPRTWRSDYNYWRTPAAQEAQRTHQKPLAESRPLGCQECHGAPFHGASSSILSSRPPTAAPSHCSTSTWPPFSSCLHHTLLRTLAMGAGLAMERELTSVLFCPLFQPRSRPLHNQCILLSEPRSVSLLKHMSLLELHHSLDSQKYNRRKKSREEFLTVSRNANLERYQKTGPRFRNRKLERNYRMGRERPGDAPAIWRRTHQIFRNTSPENHLYTSLWDLGHSEQHCSPGHHV